RAVAAAGAAAILMSGALAAPTWAEEPPTSAPSVTDSPQSGATAEGAQSGATDQPTPTESPEESSEEATIQSGPEPELSSPAGGLARAEADAPDLTAIADIQGEGATSPLLDKTVTTQGVVTAAYPEGGFNGFVIQTAGTGGDVKDATPGRSDAVLIYSKAAVSTVKIGDSVQVTGTVEEFNNLTQVKPAAAGVEVLTEPLATVAPTKTIWPRTDAEREALESMLIAPQGEFTVTNTYSTNQYGEVGLASGTTPLRQPTDVARPGSAGAAAIAADNAARGVILDDGSTTNFLSTGNTGLTPPYVSLTNPVRVGAPVTFTTPVIVDYRNNSWKLNPTSWYQADGEGAPATFANTRTEAPAAVGEDLSIASFNVLNYFTTLGDANRACVPYTDRAGNGVTVKDGCAQRGAWSAADLQRQQDKIVSAINSLDASIIGLMEIENSAKLGETADEATATLVAALNTAAGVQKWDYVRSSKDLPHLDQQDVITNAIIYQPAEAKPEGDSHALGSKSGPGQPFVNAREPIGQKFTSVTGSSDIFVAVNHFKSKGSAGPLPGDGDAGDGQGSSNASRVAQAKALRDWLPTVTDEGDAIALVGDFNSYSQEDPLQVLYKEGFVDAEQRFGVGSSSYSYQGLSGSLDHVLLNGAAASRATGADIWNINSGESVALEYSRHNAHGTLFYAADPYRSSDHDPVVVGLSDEAPATVSLGLLNINDFHGRIDKNTVAFAGTIEEQRADILHHGGGSLFLSAGDNIGASLFASAIAEDQPTIDVLNALDLASSAVGNHEFDKGYQDLVERVVNGEKGNNKAEFAYLGANVYYKGTTLPALPSYSLHTVNGVKVGVIGVVTQETPTLVTPGGIAALDFGDPVEAVNRVAAMLTDGNDANGEADVIVAEYHEGAGAGTPDGATLEQEVAAGGAFARIVTDTTPAVDVIFTGHTHKEYAWDAPIPGANGKTRPVLQTGSYGENIGRVDLTYDPVADTVVASEGRNIKRTTTASDTLVTSYPRVAEVKEITDAALAEADEKGSVPVATVSADITTAHAGGAFENGVYVGGNRDDRSSESALGNLVADSLVESLAAENLGGATIGIVNPGGLRSDLKFKHSAGETADQDGVITYAEANAVLPFVNNLWTTTLTGAQFKTLLEQQWQRDAKGEVPSRPYLQLGLSKNVSYTFDESRPEGDRITSITIDGASFDPAAEYRVGSFSFLLQGGDNFRILAQGKDTRDSGLIDRDAWITYLTKHSKDTPLAPDFTRRSVAAPALGTVKPGDTVTFTLGASPSQDPGGSRGSLDMTSLGAPATATVAVSLGDQELDTFPVNDGTAQISVQIPEGATDSSLTAVASPSGTAVTLPVTVVSEGGPVDPDDPDKPGKGALARTGASDLGLMVLAGVLLLGTGATLVRRRTTSDLD
ncbi:MAG: ExeM/NucH family extracellular endonuclease, partial [Propionibacterium sp.]|nr:ExeM/NucH family extracellular endonuclease [Propionibacterium sp.]